MYLYLYVYIVISVRIENLVQIFWYLDKTILKKLLCHIEIPEQGALYHKNFAS